MFSPFVALLCLFPIGARAEGPRFFKPGEYEAMRNAALLVVGDRVEDVVVVGIGKSPVGIVEFVKNLPGGTALSLPLSEFKVRPRRTPPQWNDPPWLSEAAEEALYAHFDKFVPSDAQLGGKKIVLVDFTNHGRSLLGAYLYLKSYLQARGRTVAVEWVALSLDLKSQKAAEALNLEGRVIRFREGNPFLDKLVDQEYDDYAEHGSFAVKEGASYEVKPRTKAFLRFRAALHRRMARDQSLRVGDSGEGAPEMVTVCDPALNQLASFNRGRPTLRKN